MKTKILNLLLLVKYSVKSQKISNIIFFIISILIIILSSIFINMPYNYNNYARDTFEKDYDLMGVVAYKEGLNYEDTILELQKYKHIINVYNSEYNQAIAKLNIMNKNNDNNIIELKPVYLDYYTPDIIKGHEIKQSNEIVCPMYLRKKVNPKTKKDLISMEDYLGKNITIEYEQRIMYGNSGSRTNKIYNKEVKVVGLYKNVVGTTYNECYMLSEDLEEIVSESRTIGTEEFLQNNVIVSEGCYTRVYIDEFKNRDYVINQLTNDGFIVEDGGFIDPALKDKIKNTAYNGGIVVSIFALFLFVTYIRRILISSKENIAMYLVYGYSSKDITNIYISQLLTITLSAYLIGLILIQSAVIIINCQLKEYIAIPYLKLYISWQLEIILLLLLIAIIYISSKLINKWIKKLTIRSILDDAIY